MEPDELVDLAQIYLVEGFFVSKCVLFEQSLQVSEVSLAHVSQFS